MVDLSGKRAIVTGARGGIGAATAMEIARSGAKVVIAGRNQGDCEKTLDRIKSNGGSAFEVSMDLSKLTELESRVGEAIEALGGVDIIVNNGATIEPMAPLGSIDVSLFDMACRVNLTGSFAVVNAAWRHLSGGRVLNVLSGAAIHPMQGWAAYCSSKAGLLMLTKMINMEGEKTGIRGFGVAPGLVDTNMQESIRNTRVNHISDIPQSQLIPPEEPAKLITWLVSGEADEYAGEMVDIRDPEIQKKYDTD